MRTVAGLAVALLVRALALFPRGYRREYGEERAWVLRMAIEERAAAGWGPLVRFVGREVRDLPLALVQEHRKAWRQKMESREGTVPAQRMTRRQYLWFLLPFVVVMIWPLSNLIATRLWTIIGWPLLALTALVTIAGLIAGLPPWAVPGLGLALGVANLLLIYNRVYRMPELRQLKAALWTEDALTGRVLYGLSVESARLVPVVVLLLLVALLAALPARSGLRQRLGHDWTILPFVLYCANLLPGVTYDPYRGLDATRILFVVVLVAGGWLYLQAARPGVRLAILLAATLLAGVVLGVGIYVIYPSQSFAPGTPALWRQWEALGPLLEAATRMVALVVVAAVGAVTGWAARLATSGAECRRVRERSMARRAR